MERLKPKNADQEIAYPILYTNRSPWSDLSLVQNLTPARLASILSEVRNGGCPADYLTLAQDIELKDLHYRSVLSTRKDAVCGLDLKVETAGEEKIAQAIADAVKTDIVLSRSAKIRSLIRDMLDGLGKGFSVNEIIWDTTGPRWKPRQYLFRDPRWFQYDKKDGRTLKLRDSLNTDLIDLHPWRFIVHEPHLISGTQIISGLAFTALFYWMMKHYDVTSWAAFIDRYGYPIRIGKYGKKATEDDIKTLKRAVAAIGSDFGAVIPEAAIIEIIEAKSTGDVSAVYEKMAVWVDKQISKLVLGQTMTVDEGSSRAQSQTHEEIRDDIADADILQVEETLNNCLVIPYVDINFGPQAEYPRIVLYKPDQKNIEQIVDAVEKLGRQGLKVKADELRNLLGLSHPGKDDETIGGYIQEAVSDTAFNSERIRLALNAQRPVKTPAASVIDELLDESGDGDFIEITDEIEAILEEAAAASTDYKSFEANLAKLAETWPADKTAKLMAIAFFKARSAGDSNFEGK